ncbi:DUF2255 family protein [Streptomyces sp. LZ34]
MTTTTAWTDDELDHIEHAEELDIASLRRDGRLSSRRTIWVVRVGNGIYVRSVYGPDSDWYRGTRARQEGRIEAGGVTKDVTFVDADEEINDAVDSAYRRRYGHYAAYIVQAITSDEASSTTLQLVPRRVFDPPVSGGRVRPPVIKNTQPTGEPCFPQTRTPPHPQPNRSPRRRSNGAKSTRVTSLSPSPYRAPTAACCTNTSAATPTTSVPEPTGDTLWLASNSSWSWGWPS